MFQVWTRNGAFFGSVSDAEHSVRVPWINNAKDALMKIPVALLTAGIIAVTPAIAGAAQPDMAKPSGPTQTQNTNPTQAPAPDESAATAKTATTAKTDTTCDTSGKSGSSKSSASSDPRPESVRAITRDTGPAPARRTPKSDTTECAAQPK